jgi:hypothetical protein
MRKDVFKNEIAEAFAGKRDSRVKTIKAMQAMTDDSMILSCLDRAMELAMGRVHASGRIKRTAAALEREKARVSVLSQDATSSARNKYQRWTRHEIDQLMNSTLTDHELAKSLGRPLYGVRTKRKKLYAEAKALNAKQAAS